MKTLGSLYTLLALAALPIATRAQTQVYPASMDFNQAAATEVSYSLPAGISRGSIRLGNLEASHARAGWSGTLRVSESYAWVTGMEWRGSLFDAPAGTPIPHELHALTLKLGAEWRFADRWMARFEADPGLYSDFEDFSAEDFNSPFALRALFSQSTNLTWVIGINVDVRSGLPVVGGPGLRWRFAPDWTLNLVLPRPTVEYAAFDTLTLFAGGELKGGSWRLAENFGTRVGEARLNNQTVDYREIRLGSGLRWKWGQRWSAILEGGWAIDRRFTFDRQNVLLNGGGAPYFQLGVVAKF